MSFGFSDWPKRQVLNDLWALARATLARAPLLSRLEDGGQGALAEQLCAVVDAKEMRLKTDDAYLPLLDVLNALVQEGAASEAAFALAVLLADAVHGQVGSAGEGLGWKDWRRRLDEMPRAWSATLARGYLAALFTQFPDGAEEPAPALLVSENRAAVVAPLVALARRMDERMIESVAMADYGDRPEQHATALRAVLADAECRFPKGDRWFPTEVVELTGHVPESGGAFWPCLALLVLDDIHNYGAYDQMTLRWMNHADTLLAAPKDIRAPLLRGIRHVMEGEALGDWDPYFDWKPAKIEALARFVPWFDAG